MLDIFTGVTQVEGFNTPLINFEILESSHYQNFEGIPNDSDLTWGDLFTYSQDNFYYYPFDDFVDYSNINFEDFIDSAPILTYAGSEGPVQRSHDNLSHINKIIRCTLSAEGKNYNGDVDLNVRVVDEDGTEDKILELNL